MIWFGAGPSAVNGQAAPSGGPFCRVAEKASRRTQRPSGVQIPGMTDTQASPTVTWSKNPSNSFAGT